MEQVRTINLEPGNKEEILPGFSEDFPYIATCAEFDSYLIPEVPWHWHNALELFYMEAGELQYVTPQGVTIFPKGSGGLVNSGVLHASRWETSPGGSIQLLHLFEPELLSGKPGSRIDRNYVQPLVRRSGLEILPLYPDSPENIETLAMIREAFDIPGTTGGYELLIRQKLCDIWLRLLRCLPEPTGAQEPGGRAGEQIKRMMVYVHEHYGEHISVTDLAETAHLSKRACFRVFQDNLHMTPVEYINAYRLQAACRMLAEDKFTVTEIAYRCGMGSSSYFGKLFRAAQGCTPLEYRRYWHDRHK